MSSQSDSIPKSSDDKTQNPASQAIEPTVKEQTGPKDDFPTERAETSAFVNSEPVREEQVQNAVKFLQHPKVRGSPVIYRRSFLERKGLSKEEIDEAFRRVPDPSPNDTPAQPVVPSQDGQLKSSLPIQQQTLTHIPQPAPVASAGSISKLGTFYRFHWSHAVFAVGLLAVSGAGTAVLFKNTIVPRLKSWICKVILEEEREPLPGNNSQKPNLAEETAAAAKAAAAAAADVAQASQEMLVSRTEEKRYFTELTNLLDVQIREMKSMSNALQKLEAQSNIPGRLAVGELVDGTTSVVNSGQYYANGTVDNALSGKSSSQPPSEELSVAPHSKSYMEILAMVQRGERPPNIREINDQPPNPNQPVPNPRLAPKPKPWEVGHPQSSSSTNGFQYPESNNGFNPGSQTIQLNGDGSVPWWQQKNVRITEIENEDEVKGGSSMPNERPVQRSWVPPQPPPVSMAEAAAAIRRPKKQVVQREHLTDDELVGRSSEISDDLERITRLSEAGGLEANGENPENSASEIQREDDLNV